MSPSGEAPTLKPYVARLANAMVAVLGPEFTHGSDNYRRCKCLLVGGDGQEGPVGATEAGAAQTAARRAEGLDSTLAEMETVLFVQQLILFSPKAVPAYKHIALLEVGG